MLQVPVSPAAGTSLTQTISLLLLAGGVMLAMVAVPAIRERFKEHLTQIDNLVRGPVTTKQEDSVLTVAEKENEPSTVRREIDEFDLSIFE